MNTASPPVNEQISQSLLATLRLVTAAAGFNCDLEVERYKNSQMRTAPGDAYDARGILHDMGDDPLSAENGVPDGGANGWLRNYALVVYVPEVADDSEVDFDTVCNVIRADVEKAVMDDVHQGGLALNTTLAGAERFLGDAGPSGVVVKFSVHYHVTEADPYTRR